MQSVLVKRKRKYRETETLLLSPDVPVVSAAAVITLADFLQTLDTAAVLLKPLPLSNINKALIRKLTYAKSS